MLKNKRKIVPSQKNPLIEKGYVPSYRDVATLSTFLRVRGGLSSRFFNGVTAKTQRQISKAVKRARHLGLLPFVNKID